MKNIIIGNGIDIQFGGLDYTNKSIIERAIQNLETNKFSEEVYPKIIKKWMLELHSIIPNLITGEYDQLAVLQDEKEELTSFKNFYSEKANISDIGFEYYFLLSNLHCRKNKIKNPERFYFQEFLRRLFLDSIFNEGKINQIHNNFPPKLIECLNSFDNIFTTNYDSNLEIATNKKVNYLHGAFHFLDPVYDKDSFRNRLDDKPAKKTPPVSDYEHCYSNAITGSSGAFKMFSSNQYELANSAIDKYAEGYKNNPEIKVKIDTWENHEDPIIKKLYQAIMLKVQEPELGFSIVYAINKLKEIEGQLTFIGLSPNNDSHIMKVINENDGLKNIVFYYYSEVEKEIVQSIFPKKKIYLKDIRRFWSEI